MKEFETPTMEIQRLAPEDVFTNSCTTEALGCDSCYCSGVKCPSKTGGETAWGCDD